MEDNINFKQSSIKKNFFFNLTMTLSTFLFPILTFPYVSRVLGPDGIGKVQFILSFVQYFIFFAMLGIPLYGIREIAKARKDIFELKKLFSTLLLLNIFTTILVFIVYIIIVIFTPHFKEDLVFYSAASIMILLCFSSVDWFFSGIERFKYIAIRSVVIRFSLVALMYIAVQKRTDVLPYLWVSIAGSILNNICNLFAARKYINFRIVKKEDFKIHIKPLFFIFSTVVAASIYSQLNVLFLGFLKGFKDVGFYSSGIKINMMCLPFMTALSVVLMPQIAESFREKNEERIKYLINESLEYIILFGIPMAVGLIGLAPEIILLVSGKEFIPSIFAMQINAPILLIIGISTICSVQILTPAAKDKENAKAVICGLLVSVVLNLVLIPQFGYLGATVANILAELTVMFVFAYFAFKVIKFNINWKLFLHCLAISIFFLPIIYLLRNLIGANNIIVMALSMFICGLYYAFFLIKVIKNQFFIKHLNTMRLKFNI